MTAKRCSWCERDALYRAYHDEEWGRPIHDDRRLFELLVLESSQAGLSWYTILAKREGFRAALDGFDYRLIADYDDAKVEALMQDTRDRPQPAQDFGDHSGCGPIHGNTTGIRIILRLHLGVCRWEPLREPSPQAGGCSGQQSDV